ncbi:hypothetical protein Q3G72_034458 [Acer saccharum]|nr:hypothetical protein Q3G72_034458 [Acer saccharum]
MIGCRWPHSEGFDWYFALSLKGNMRNTVKVPGGGSLVDTLRCLILTTLVKSFSITNLPDTDNARERNQERNQEREREEEEEESVVRALPVAPVIDS